VGMNRHAVAHPIHGSSMTQCRSFPVYRVYPYPLRYHGSLRVLKLNADWPAERQTDLVVVFGWPSRLIVVP